MDYEEEGNAERVAFRFGIMEDEEREPSSCRDCWRRLRLSLRYFPNYGCRRTCECTDKKKGYRGDFYFDEDEEKCQGTGAVVGLLIIVVIIILVILGVVFITRPASQQTEYCTELKLSWSTQQSDYFGYVDKTCNDKALYQDRTGQWFIYYWNEMTGWVVSPDRCAYNGTGFVSGVNENKITDILPEMWTWRGHQTVIKHILNISPSTMNVAIKDIECIIVPGIKCDQLELKGLDMNKEWNGIYDVLVNGSCNNKLVWKKEGEDKFLFYWNKTSTWMAGKQICNNPTQAILSGRSYMLYDAQEPEDVFMHSWKEFKDGKWNQRKEVIVTCKSCAVEYFSCGNGRCVPKDWRCDGSNNCGDWSDESHCDCIAAGERKCDTGLCRPSNHWCDGEIDCLDSSDELHCNCNTTCDTGQCIMQSDWCDGFTHCTDGSDEKNNCKCAEGTYNCSGRCITQSQVCDGVIDCPDFSDETSCNCTGGDQFLCHNGVCIDIEKTCDDVDDCGDQSDEIQYCRVCEAGEFACHTGPECIPAAWMCDSHPDCSYGEDEENCEKKCSNPEELPCQSGKCIPKIQHCDGIFQCEDHSDEMQCMSLVPYTSGNILHVFYNRQTWMPVCYNGWNAIWASKACEALGRGGPVSTREFDGKHFNSSKLEVTMKVPGRSVLQGLAIKSSCDNGTVLSLNCANEKCGARPALITNSTNTKQRQSGQWPWQVALLNKGVFQCAGTVIHHQWVITAAHCLTVSSDADLTIRVGSTDLQAKEVQEINASKIIVHPMYDPLTLYNDIGLVRLSNPLSLTSSVAVGAICLPKPFRTLTESTCYATGWRDVSVIGNTFSGPLEAKMKLVDAYTCDDYHEGLDTTAAKITMVQPDKMFCAQYIRGNKTACFSDSGGSLACSDKEGSWSLVGITSTAPRLRHDLRCRLYGTFTNVTAYVDWVNDTMQTTVDG